MDRVRQITRVDEAHRRGFVGNRVTVAVMDTGIVQHIDFGNRVIGFMDPLYGKALSYDDNGHGTHVAGIVAGSGFASKGKYRGMAPGCNVLAIKVLDRMGNGDTKKVVKALKWLIQNKEKYNVRILNISVGMLTSAKEEEQRFLIDAVEEVWNEGIVVVAAAGNNGPLRGSVTVPGLCPSIITVGSSDDEEHNTGKLGLIKGYSGRGPTDACVMKPEVVAPGTSVVSCGRGLNSYDVKSGTSMATPVVAGAIAILLGRYPSLTPADVKLRLHETLVDMGRPRQVQGWGRLDVVRLIR